MEFLSDNYLLITGAVVTVIWVIVSATSTRKDDAIFFRIYSKLRAVLPTLPDLKQKKDD